MSRELEDLWSDGASDYDRIVRRQLSNGADVGHWTEELSSVVGRPPSDVLDIGCGPGFFTVILARLGHRVTSVDGSEEMVRSAARHLARQGIDAHLYRGDAVLLEREETDSMDAIVSRDVVWTLYDPAAAYRRWLEILRPGGVLAVYDGDYRRGRRSPRLSAWQMLSRALIRLTEGKRSSTEGRDRNASAFSELPAVHAERPRLDRRLLEEAGYVDIRIRADRYRNSRRNPEHWKYGYQGRKFAVTARKPKAARTAEGAGTS